MADLGEKDVQNFLSEVLPRKVESRGEVGILKLLDHRPRKALPDIHAASPQQRNVTTAEKRRKER